VFLTEARPQPIDDAATRPVGLDLLPILGSVRRLTRVAQLLVAQSAKRQKLAVSDLSALARIADSRGVAPSALAQSLPLDQSSVTELADRLERAGLITRTRVKDDRRRISLQATPDGEHVVNEAFGPAFAKLIAIIESTPPSDRAAISRFLIEV
jgi:DNA-binding MarR family transcriptional regulator